MDFRDEVGKLIEKEGLSFDLIQDTPNPDMGDFAVPCFSLSKTLKKSPQIIAQDLAKKIKPTKYIEKVVANGPYLNFYIEKGVYNKEILTSKSKKKKINKTIVIDFSQPNIMKPFNIAHLRSTMIGNAIYKILNFEGYNVVRVNHLGDWGTQFGKMMYAFESWGDRKELKKDPIKYMLKLYVKFHKEAESDPSLNDRGREWFAKLEQGDKKARSYWEEFSKLSLVEYEKMYKRLDVSFDSWAGEAFYEPMLASTIKDLEKKGVTKESEGALIVDLEEYGMSPCIIRKSDGSTIYATRDLAAAKYRHKEYNFYKNLYVVDVRQSLHFKQVFKTLELAKYKWFKDCIHLPFGTMNFKDEVMSTRKGKIVFLEDVLDKSVQRVKEIIKEKNPNLKDKDKVAEEIGIGAIIFWDLSHDRIKDLNFSWDSILDFEGETGPYIQYAHARASSILKKAGKVTGKPDFKKLELSIEKELIKHISLYEEFIHKAAENYKPSVLAKYLVTLVQLFNEFYQKAPVLKESDSSLVLARLEIVKKTKCLVKEGLGLLSIKSPEQM
jgi:arginyl-tRNA synthetase